MNLRSLPQDYTSTTNSDYTKVKGTLHNNMNLYFIFHSCWYERRFGVSVFCIVGSSFQDQFFDLLRFLFPTRYHSRRAKHSLFYSTIVTGSISYNAWRDIQGGICLQGKEDHVKVIFASYEEVKPSLPSSTHGASQQALSSC